MTFIDLFVVILFIFAAIEGFKKGFIKELTSLIGTIVIFVVSYNLKGIVGNFLCLFLPFFIYNLILKFTGAIDKLINKLVLIKIPFKILGSVVSIANMYLLVFMFLILLSVPFGNTNFMKKSFFTETIVYKTPIISKSSETVINVLDSIITLDTDISKGTITTNEGNLKILDLLLKYNMIDKDTIIDLYNKGKIKEIKDIETVVLNY